tara:strand:- start:270 stop:890 length:621 start_codon:yes stop_codon:yes gene_type:complete
LEKIFKKNNCRKKRLFDIFFSTLLLIFASPIIFFAWIIASIETRSNGFFCQQRVGKDGKLFFVFKIKTMFDTKVNNNFVTTSNDPRITFLGQYFRKFKIDELPQLFNVLIGNMSFVGPRPDVKGFADELVGENALILKLKPGITGLSSLKYKNEEHILSKVNNPIEYNKNVIYPEKVKLELQYIKNWSIMFDVKLILFTVLGILKT